MSFFYIIKSKHRSEMLNKMLEVFVKNKNYIALNDPQNLPDLTNKKILFCMELNEIGHCPDIYEFIMSLNKRGSFSLAGSVGAILIHSKDDLYTKSAASTLIFLANQLGCSFIGHPLVEATGNLSNFLTWQKSLNMSLDEICIEQCNKLYKRFLDDKVIKFEMPKLVALHSSSKNTSNTFMLWNMIKSHITECLIEDLNVANGTIHDCIGCSYKTCTHYSEQNSCFYGGIMVSEIIPAIEKANAVIMVCPNYNDAISANLTAVINRITALYRKMSFYEKYLFLIVVSGNSGSDSVAKQLIGALNVNKGFRLPHYSTIMATANDPGAINNVPDIDKKSKLFAENIMRNIKK